MGAQKKSPADGFTAPPSSTNGFVRAGQVNSDSNGRLFKKGDKVVAYPKFAADPEEARIATVVGFRQGGEEVFINYEDCALLFPRLAKMSSRALTSPSASSQHLNWLLQQNTTPSDRSLYTGDRRCAEWHNRSALSICTAEAERKVRAKRERPDQQPLRCLKQLRRYHQKTIELGTGHDAHDHAHTHPMRPRFIEVVDFGNYELHTWYHSPLPPPFGTMRHLFICPFTLKYFRKRKLLDAHIAAIPAVDRHPPGYVQYTSPDPPPPEASCDDGMTITAVCDPKVIVYKIDGSKEKLFCQNLCLFSKMFLDGKTLVWEANHKTSIETPLDQEGAAHTDPLVHEFVFYVFCEMLPHGHEMFGYFSREKRSDTNHLACILTMPHKQRKGYGGLIIDYSYKLARKENKPGTPERPLSDLGWVAFREYWERVLIQHVLSFSQRGLHNVDVAELVNETGISKEDILETIGKNSRLAPLKLVKFVHHAHEIQCHDSEMLVSMYQLLTNNKHRLIVDPSCMREV